MSSTENKIVVKKLFEGLNKRELGVFDDLCTANFVWHGNNDQNKKEIQNDIRGVLGAFPDAEWSIHDLLCDQDKVIMRWAFHGTFTNNWGVVPATGKQITYGGITICRLEAGQIAELWNNENLLSLYRQMGFKIQQPK